MLSKLGDTESTRRRLLFGPLIGTKEEIEASREQLRERREQEGRRRPSGAAARIKTPNGRLLIGKRTDDEVAAADQRRAEKEAKEYQKAENKAARDAADAPVKAILVAQRFLAADQRLTNKQMQAFLAAKKDTWPEAAGGFSVPQIKDQLRERIMAWSRAHLESPSTNDDQEDRLVGARGREAGVGLRDDATVADAGTEEELDPSAEPAVDADGRERTDTVQQTPGTTPGSQEASVMAREQESAVALTLFPEARRPRRRKNRSARTHTSASGVQVQPTSTSMSFVPGNTSQPAGMACSTRSRARLRSAVDDASEAPLPETEVNLEALRYLKRLRLSTETS